MKQKGDTGEKRNSSQKNNTNGVKTLLGDPKKAIIKLAIPMILAMSVNTIYNLADALWVSGLGPDALASVGFVYPFFFMLMAIAAGLGVGGGAAISRKIGEKNKQGADNVGVHTLILTIILSIIFTVPLILLARPIFQSIGAGETLTWTVSYAQILFAGTIFIFFSYVANAILRGEGDARRAMYALAFGAGMNIILDPIFIYTLKLEVAGAAYATVLSMAVSSAVLFYWLFHKKDTYISFSFKGFNFNKNILIDILRVGLPAMLMQLSMSLMMLILNFVIVIVNSTDGIAVYTTGWRISTIAILPLLGIATAVVSVAGAAYGAKSYNKLKTALVYSIKIGLIIEIVIAFLIFILAPQITMVFTQAKDSARIVDDLELFLRIMCLFYPTVAFGMLSSAMFQGIGKGFYSLLATVLRAIVLTSIFAAFFAFYLNMGLEGIWWGIVLANVIGSIIAFLWGQLHVRKLITKHEPLTK